jgi:hypothetical protein
MHDETPSSQTPDTEDRRQPEVAEVAGDLACGSHHDTTPRVREKDNFTVPAYLLS